MQNPPAMAQPNGLTMCQQMGGASTLTAACKRRRITEPTGQTGRRSEGRQLQFGQDPFTMVVAANAGGRLLTTMDKVKRGFQRTTLHEP